MPKPLTSNERDSLRNKLIASENWAKEHIVDGKKLEAELTALQYFIKQLHVYEKDYNLAVAVRLKQIARAKAERKE